MEVQECRRRVVSQFGMDMQEWRLDKAPKQGCTAQDCAAETHEVPLYQKKIDWGLGANLPERIGFRVWAGVPEAVSESRFARYSMSCRTPKA